MIVRVVEPPKPFLSLEWVKQHLHVEVEDTDQDMLIAGYIASAVAWLDGPAGWLGRCLGEQVLEMVGNSFPTCRLPYGPTVAIDSIVYVDANGRTVTMPAEDYRLLPDGRIHAETWPVVGTGPDAVRIRWRAGYPDHIEPAETPGGEEVHTVTVPQPIIQAILLLVGQWFKSRENVVTGTIATALPFAVEALLSPYRVWR